MMHTVNYALIQVAFFYAFQDPLLPMEFQPCGDRWRIYQLANMAVRR